MAEPHHIDTDPTARPGWGVFWMIVTGILFVGVTALVKHLGTRNQWRGARSVNADERDTP